jgi:hypothetical protein
MRDPDIARKTGRTAAYLIPVVVLIIFLFRERSPFGSGNTSFAVSSKQEITRIDLDDGTNKVELLKNGDGWLVNDKYEARRSAVLFMIKILREIRIKSPVSQQAFSNEITGKNINPVRIRVYQGGRAARSFMVYQTGSNPYGNVMKLRPSSKPYIVYMPGIEAEIGSCFSTDEFYWQPFTLLNLLPSEISGITVENISEPSSSFVIGIRGRQFSLSDPAKELQGWDTSRVKRYVSYFTHVPFESPATGMNKTARDSIEKDTPLYRLTVEETGGEKIVLTLWERWKMENGIRTKDTDRLWAKINNREVLFIVRFMDIDPVLKKRSYFFPG